jgi:ACR3 family arsenite transporter
MLQRNQETVTGIRGKIRDIREEIMKKSPLGIFETYLSLWVILSMIVGVLIGKTFPGFVAFMDRWTLYQISIPVAILIWLMIYPMMLQIDFGSIMRVGRNPKGLIITLVVNWLIKPFTMFGLSWLFFKIIFHLFLPPALASEYLAGAVLLGAAPCTAMVFVWSYLSGGDAPHTLVQVAINDLVILVIYAPLVLFLLGVSKIQVPYGTVFASVIIFVVIPLTFGYLTRVSMIKKKGLSWYESSFLPKFKPITVIALLATLVLIFSFQGNTIMKDWFNIILIAIPLVLQTYLIFWIGYGLCIFYKVPYTVSAPAAMVGASNFFELAVAVAISLWGLKSGAALATTVGVLTEVPVMLHLVSIAKKSKHWFPHGWEKNK